jgi:trans-aconitate methyltransferase
LSWEKYYEKNKGRALRPLYSQAIQFLSPWAKQALDLGCGVGVEVLDLLRRGLEVHAVDQESKAIELVQASSENSKKLQTHLTSLEKWNAWPAVDFLFAYHSLPFCAAESFESVMDKALSSVVTNGILAVSFFGPEDEWVKENKVVGICAEEVKRKLNNFEILHFEETKEVGPTALQGNKLWHVVEVIGRRRV